MIVFYKIINAYCPKCRKDTTHELGRSTIDGKLYARCVRSDCEDMHEVHNAPKRK